jgi:hypothetical protein
MFTYRLTERNFKNSKLMKFPNDASVTFEMRPGYLFGNGKPTGFTFRVGSRFETQMNPHTGGYEVLTAAPLDPVELRLSFPATRCQATVTANVLRLDFRVDSFDHLNAFVTRTAFLLPTFLSLGFVDPVFVARVEGRVGEVPLEVTYRNFNPTLDYVDAEGQRRRLDLALNLAFSERLLTSYRLIAAIEYFYVAERLLAASQSQGEFVAEIIVNFAKSLLALFDHEMYHPAGKPLNESGSLDRTRNGLRAIGCDELDIERVFIPAIALRNGLDSAHPALDVVSPRDATTLLHYAQAARQKFRGLLTTLVSSADAASKLPPHAPRANDGYDSNHPSLVRLREWYGEKSAPEAPSAGSR